MLISFLRSCFVPIPAALVILGLTGHTAAPPNSASASDKKHDMRGMDMSCMADMNGVDMSAMGASMAAMECHMYVTPLRPAQAGDEEKAKAVVAAVKATWRSTKITKRQSRMGIDRPIPR